MGPALRGAWNKNLSHLIGPPLGESNSQGYILKTQEMGPGRSVLAAIILLAMVASQSPAFGEWYVAGFGGKSISPNISNAEMNTYGERLAYQQFPLATNSNLATLTQTFKTSDLDMKSSATFGGKVGYFFKEEKLPWLGVELEAFTNTPTIKSQTVTTQQDINYAPKTVQLPCQGLPNPTCPIAVTNKGTLQLSESSLRVITVAFNVIARYPGEVLQPYVGVGAGALYFQSSSGSIQGRQWTPGFNAQAGLKVLIAEEWGLFVEGKYNLANLSNFDPTFGLSGQYSVFHAVAGVAYHF